MLPATETSVFDDYYNLLALHSFSSEPGKGDGDDDDVKSKSSFAKSPKRLFSRRKMKASSAAPMGAAAPPPSVEPPYDSLALDNSSPGPATTTDLIFIKQKSGLMY
jgi:hypothetical protein